MRKVSPVRTGVSRPEAGKRGDYALDHVAIGIWHRWLNMGQAGRMRMSDGPRDKIPLRRAGSILVSAADRNDIRGDAAIGRVWGVVARARYPQDSLGSGRGT